MPTLLITVDSLRADHLGQYGYDRDTMPVLDELADDGTVFTQAFSNGPYTRISIPSFHTSRYLAYGDLSAFPTIGSVLGEGGVRTAGIGTQTGIGMVPGRFDMDELIDLGRDSFGETDLSATERLIGGVNSVAATVSDRLQHTGMDRLYRALARPYNAVVSDEAKYQLKGYTNAERVTDRAIDWVSEQADDEFFLWIHYMEAHRPYGIHDEDPAYLDGPVDEGRIRDLMKTAGMDPESITDDERRLLVDLYDSDIRYCSRHLTRLVESLRDQGLWNETNVLFSSDHGEEFGEHGLYFHRNYPYDELINVPLIVRPADGSPPARIDEQRELLDIAPTVCAMHGVDDSDAEFLGTPLYEGGPRDVVALGQPGMDVPAVAVRADGWKYVHTAESSKLYDLESDPDEQENVVEANPRVAARLRRKIPDRLFGRDTKSPRPPENEVDREQLEALGYMELREADST